MLIFHILVAAVTTEMMMTKNILQEKGKVKLNQSRKEGEQASTTIIHGEKAPEKNS
jgi:hypothetical protein